MHKAFCTQLELYSKKDFEPYMRGLAFLDQEESIELAKLASGCAHPILEVGTAWGASTCVFLLNSLVKVHSIDPFVKDSHGDWQANFEECRASVASVMGALKVQGWEDRWTLHVGWSHQVSALLLEKKLGLVYLDGDHHYLSTREAVRDWGEKLIVGGYLCLHDSCSPRKDDVWCYGYSGPTRVVAELKEDFNYEFVKSVFSLSIFQRTQEVA